MAVISEEVDKAKKHLEAGEVIGIPTETVYGLAGNALDATVVAKIFEIKERPFFDPLIVHIASPEQIEQYAHHVPDAAIALAEKFWPGPLTLVLPKKEVIPDLVSAGLPTVALRVPNHPMTQDLLHDLTFPLAAPSANPFGYISPTTAQHVNDQLGDRIPFILDGGPCAVGVESTIVGFEEGVVTLYRFGGIPPEEIEKVAGPVSAHVKEKKIAAPGLFESHYAPQKPLKIGHIPTMLAGYKGEEIGVISFQTDYGVPNQVILSKTGNLYEAAKNVFAALRKFDNSSAVVLLSEEVPPHGLGLAINDRLRRASHRFR